MQGGTFRYPKRAEDPTVDSWLNALENSHARTVNVFKGLNPWDAVVQLLREKHDLLIGEPTAERVLWELGNADSEHPKTMTVRGRNLITGLPGQTEISSVDIQAVDNSQIALRHITWLSDESNQTIAEILYAIAAHKINWLYRCVVEEPPPDTSEVEGIFERDQDKLEARLKHETLAQHWHRSDVVHDQIIQAYRDMTLEDFHRTRLWPEPEMRRSPEWVLHELCQFEAERRSEISRLLAAARKALDSNSDD